MTDHDPTTERRKPDDSKQAGTSNTPTHYSRPTTTPGAGADSSWRRRLADSAAGRWAGRTFNKASIGALARKLRLGAVRQSPGLVFMVVATAIVLIINVAGLASFIAMRSEKQAWAAEAAQRERIKGDITSLEAERAAAHEKLHTVKGQIETETGRLAELRAALGIAQNLLEEAQQQRTIALNEAQRLGEQNESLAAKIDALATRRDDATKLVEQLEAERDRLGREVEVAKKALAGSRAEVDAARTHLAELDNKAAETLAGIRKSREDLVKAQGELDAVNAEVAQAGAERDAAATQLKSVKLQLSEARSELDSLTKQASTLKAQMEQDRAAAQALAAKKTEAEAALASLAEQIDAASKTLSQKQGAAAAQESLITAAETRLEATKTRLSTIKAELKPLEEQRLSLEADIAAKRKELDTLRQRIEDAAKAAATIRASSSNTTPATLPANQNQNSDATDANGDQNEKGDDTSP